MAVPATKVSVLDPRVKHSLFYLHNDFYFRFNFRAATIVPSWKEILEPDPCYFERTLITYALWRPKT